MSEINPIQNPANLEASQDSRTVQQINRISEKLAKRSLGIVEKAREVAPGEEWNDAGYTLEKREMSPPGEIVTVEKIHNNDEDSYLKIFTEDDSGSAPYNISDRKVTSVVSGDIEQGQKILEIGKDSVEIVNLGSPEGFSRISTNEPLPDGARDSAAQSFAAIRDKIAKVEESIQK